MLGSRCGEQQRRVYPHGGGGSGGRRGHDRRKWARRALGGSSRPANVGLCSGIRRDHRRRVMVLPVQSSFGRSGEYGSSSAERWPQCVAKIQLRTARAVRGAIVPQACCSLRTAVPLSEPSRAQAVRCGTPEQMRSRGWIAGGSTCATVRRAKRLAPVARGQPVGLGYSCAVRCSSCAPPVATAVHAAAWAHGMAQPRRS